MSREQQIEESWKGIYKTLMLEADCSLSGEDCSTIADLLIANGYRKADELIAENEQLRERHADLDRQIRAEARREFAEKLKNYYIKNAGSLKGSINCDLVAYHIEQILTDMERKEEQ